MSNFIADTLNVKYLPPMNIFSPIEGRKYTVVHFDESEQWNLSIGYHYDDQLIDEALRDEVLAEWQKKDGEYQLLGKIHISDGEYDYIFSRIRFLIFKKEVDLALTVMIYGEKEFYVHYPWLLDCPIYVQFQSDFPEYHQLIYYGTPRQYLHIASNKKMVKTQV